MQSASRSTLSSRRWSPHALVALAALMMATSAVAQRPADTTTTLTAASAEGGSSAGSFVLTAHVSPIPVADAHPGSVSFVDTDASGQVRGLGSSPLDAEGMATLSAGPLPPGAHSVRALFSGTAGANASSSAAAQLTAQAALAPDFSLTATPTSLNLQAGVQGSVAVTITPLNGFSNYVSLSCAGLPVFTTCTFLPSNAFVNANGGQTTMTLNTVAPSGNTGAVRRDTGLVYAFLLPGALGLAGLGWAGRRRGLRLLALLCVVGSLVAGAGSCAQRYTYLNRGPTPNPGTPDGNSIIRIFGTSVNGAEATVRCVQVALTVISTNTANGSNVLTPCPAS